MKSLQKQISFASLRILFKQQDDVFKDLKKKYLLPLNFIFRVPTLKLIYCLDFKKESIKMTFESIITIIFIIFIALIIEIQYDYLKYFLMCVNLFVYIVFMQISSIAEEIEEMIKNNPAIFKNKAKL